MNCTHCRAHQCRTLADCKVSSFDKSAAEKAYTDPEIQKTVQCAAHLVDNGRAGTLNRLQELAEYARDQGFTNIGLAYCYGMESDVTLIAGWLRKQGFKVSAVSCTVGGMAQDAINTESTVHKIACNPVGQGMQLQTEKVDIVAAIGLCLGHDMLLAKYIDVPLTTLVVKDRTNGHHPLQAARDMIMT